MKHNAKARKDARKAFGSNPDLPPGDEYVERIRRGKAVPGEPCPTCGRVVAKYKDNAARQAAYRKRKGEA